MMGGELSAYAKMTGGELSRILHFSYPVKPGSKPLSDPDCWCCLRQPEDCRCCVCLPHRGHPLLTDLGTMKREILRNGNV